MTGHLAPGGVGELCEAIAQGAAARRAFEVAGGGTKRALGRPVEAECRLDLGKFTGIGLYEPAELVFGAGAATPLDEIEALLAENRQQLAFEPPDFRALLGVEAGRPTLGGAIACNLSGPRRIQAFAARDHLLGVKAVTGRGEAIKTGGRVVKNVTGYDLCKLLAGSFGTLAAMTELNLRVAPAPERTRTVLVFGLDDAHGLAALRAALATPFEVSGAAHLPRSLAARSAVDYVAGAGAPVTACRVEGFGPSAEARCAALREGLAGFGPLEELHGRNSELLWREIRDVLPFAGEGARIVWRLSVAPAAGAGVVAAIRAQAPDLEAYYDWGGGLIWLAVPESADGAEGPVRGAVEAAGGHALLVRASPGLRRQIPVFHPQPAALARLTARVKAAFDPRGVLNSGRMYARV